LHAAHDLPKQSTIANLYLKILLSANSAVHACMSGRKIVSTSCHMLIYYRRLAKHAMIKAAPMQDRMRYSKSAKSEYLMRHVPAAPADLDMRSVHQRRQIWYIDC
jgi:hypothetical protein